MFNFNDFRANRIEALSSLNADLGEFIAALTDWLARAVPLWQEGEGKDDQFDELIDELDDLGIGKSIITDARPVEFTEVIGRVFLVIDNLKKKRKQVDRAISSFEEDFAKVMDSLTT